MSKREDKVSFIFNISKSYQKDIQKKPQVKTQVKKYVKQYTSKQRLFLVYRNYLE